MDNSDFYRNNNTHRRGLFSYLLVALAGAVVGGMLVLTFAPTVLLEKTVPEEDIKHGGYEPPDQMAIVPEKVEISIATLAAKRVAPAVVGIRAAKHKDDAHTKESKVESTWSGVIVDKSGYILTNYDVGTASDISVVLPDGQDIPAEAVWKDAELDIAILKIEAGDYIFAELGDSNNLEIGEMAIAIGNPPGLSFQGSVTRGIVSAVNRVLSVNKDKFMEDLIEIDVSINKGNTGGPLVNSEGRVIGINTVRVDGVEGMGYAIPVNTVVPVIKRLVETGEFNTPYIGITGLSKEIAYFQGNKIDSGIFVEDIDRKGPFFEAGIRKGDIILEIDDIPVNKATSLKQSIFSHDVGNKVKIKIQDRSGEVKIIQVVVRPAAQG